MMKRSMDLEPQSTRRQLFQSAAAATAATAALGVLAPTQASAGAAAKSASSGRIKQSVCRWCYGKISLDDLCVAAKRLGLVGIDLLGPADFETVKKHGLVCTMVGSHPLDKGLADPKYWDASFKALNAAIEATSKRGVAKRDLLPRQQARHRRPDRHEQLPESTQGDRSGRREGQRDSQHGAAQTARSTTTTTCATARAGASSWSSGSARVNFKLLYDIYHMQIMEGDVIRTIRKDHDAFGHYHTGGNPGRHELDDTQELNYKAICPRHRRRRLPGLHGPRVHPDS